MDGGLGGGVGGVGTPGDSAVRCDDRRDASAAALIGATANHKGATTHEVATRAAKAKCPQIRENPSAHQPPPRSTMAAALRTTSVRRNVCAYRKRRPARHHHGQLTTGASASEGPTRCRTTPRRATTAARTAVADGSHRGVSASAVKHNTTRGLGRCISIPITSRRGGGC